jgi:hypothetical protein
MAGRLGYGPNHDRLRLDEPDEAHERELREARRTIDKLHYRVDALERTARGGQSAHTCER